MRGLHLKILNFFLPVILFGFSLNATAQNNLNFYIQTAMQNSPLLKEYQNQTELNRIDSMRLKAGLGMQVSAVSNNLYAPVVKGWGYDNAITNGTNVSAQVSVSKEITGKRNRQNQFGALSLQNQSVQNSSKISEQELKKNVSSLYISAYGSWQQFSFNSEMLELMDKEKDVLKKLTEAGTCRQTDFLSFMVTLQQQELQVERTKGQYQNDFAMLNYTCGIEDTSFTALTDPDLKAEKGTELFNSIFYRQFEIDSLKLVNSDQQINFSYQPKISLVADGGYLSSLAFQPYKNFGISAGVSISIPLYDGGQRKMQHDQVAINQLTRLDYRDFFANQFHQQNNQLHQQLLAKQRLGEKINRQISYSQALMDAYRKLLEAGDVQLTEYILSIGNYLSAKNMSMENIVEKYQIINELNFLNRTK
jgi:outer membrane protein TolC